MPRLHSALLFAAALAAAFAAGSKKLVLLTWSRDDHLLLVLSICCALFLAAVLLAAGFFVRFDRSVALLVEVNQAALAASTRPTTMALSSLSRTAACTLLDGALLDMLLGEEDELRDVDAPVAPWEWPLGESEPQGTPALLAHLQLSLEKLGVKWGKGGYDLLDVHAERSLYAFQVGSVRYVGGTDGLIVPHSISPETAKRQARVVIELKRRSTEGLGNALAQAVAELVAASGASAHPCLLFLTDGTECDVFCLGCDCVTHWPRRTLAQGLTHLARNAERASPSRVHRSEGVRCEDPALTRTIARLHLLADAAATGGAVEAIAEQVAGALAAEGLPCCGGSEAERCRVLDLVQEFSEQWQPALEAAELPKFVRHMYA
jgi:hypothetical protein